MSSIQNKVVSIEVQVLASIHCSNGAAEATGVSVCAIISSQHLQTTTVTH